MLNLRSPDPAKPIHAGAEGLRIGQADHTVVRLPARFFLRTLGAYKTGRTLVLAGQAIWHADGDSRLVRTTRLTRPATVPETFGDPRRH